MKSLFIDTFYDPKSQIESQEFETNVEKLWDFATNTDSFECKDIKRALTELMEAKQDLFEMEKQLEDIKDQLEDQQQAGTTGN